MLFWLVLCQTWPKYSLNVVQPIVKKTTTIYNRNELPSKEQHQYWVLFIAINKYLGQPCSLACQFFPTANQTIVCVPLIMWKGSSNKSADLPSVSCFEGVGVPPPGNISNIVPMDCYDHDNGYLVSGPASQPARQLPSSAWLAAWWLCVLFSILEIY